MRENRINTYAQNLSVPGLEALPINFEAAQFLLSATGKIEGIESQHDVTFAQKVP